ncbi:MAG: DUF1345 domain-containing protein [Sphingobium sp.]|nr:DUF1345 domain-containing protein [Sphingobium sp.]
MATRSAPFWHLPWRYALFLLALLSIVPLAQWIGLQSGIMAGFDVAALVFASTLHSVFAHNPEAMRRSARQNDANRTLMLVMTAIVMAVMLVVVATELRQKATPSTAQLILIIATLVLGWIFSNLIYTFHYAFLFYRDGGRGSDHGGLEYPERPEPDYWDFAYFAFTLGMTFQTSDVAITSPAIRRVALFHSFAAFVFNLGVIAFSINIIGGG